MYKQCRIRGGRADVFEPRSNMLRRGFTGLGMAGFYRLVGLELKRWQRCKCLAQGHAPTA
jgi:hypothetical protein